MTYLNQAPPMPRGRVHSGWEIILWIFSPDGYLALLLTLTCCALFMAFIVSVIITQALVLAENEKETIRLKEET